MGIKEEDAQCFNPRTRVGCDVGDAVIMTGYVFQSTHPCGVRRAALKIKSLSQSFQSTHPCGVRHHPQSSLAHCHRFQSTHPCGVRRRYALLSILNSKFQSTHPCGVRQWLLLMQLWQPVFQSTHPCGVRLTLTTNLGSAKVSIHAPVWGATQDYEIHGLSYSVSIHAPVWGATQSDGVVWSKAGFNPRTRVGCDAKHF